MNQGKKVKRSGWSEDAFIYLSKEGFIVVDQDDHLWVPNNENFDFVADDWIVLDA